jgi:hypothetical protein
VGTEIPTTRATLLVLLRQQGGDGRFHLAVEFWSRGLSPGINCDHLRDPSPDSPYDRQPKDSACFNERIRVMNLNRAAPIAQRRLNKK